MNIKVKAYAYDNVGNDSSVKGTASVTFDNLFKVTKLSVVEGKNGLFVNMPNQKLKEPDENGNSYKDTAYPLTKELRDKLSEAVIESFRTGQEIELEVTAKVPLNEKVSKAKSMNHQIKLSMAEQPEESQKAKKHKGITKEDY